MLYDKKWDKPVEVELEPWRKHLLDAAQYIRDHGWCQHNSTAPDGSGRVCAVGALGYVAAEYGYDYIHSPDYHTAFQKLQLELSTSIPHWNDQPSRTKEEVIAAFEQAARRGG